MGWIEVISTVLDYYLTWDRKYWKTIVFSLILATSVSLIWNFISGYFFQEVTEVRNYIDLVVIGVIFSHITKASAFIMSKDFSKPRRLVWKMTYGGFKYIIIDRLVVVFRHFLYFLLGYYIPLFFIFKRDLFFFFMIFIFSFILSLCSISIAFLLSSYAIILRGEASYIEPILSKLFLILVPAYYSLSSFKFYDYLWLFPPSIFMEEFRKYLIQGCIDMHKILLASIVDVLYFIIAYIIFWKVFNYVRRKGIVMLK